MPVTCATCARIFGAFESMAEHITQTNEGQVGEWNGFDMEALDNPIERERIFGAMQGFSHRKYKDKNNYLIPQGIMTEICVLLTAGAKQCVECRAEFGNNPPLYRHILDLGHATELGETYLGHVRESMEKFQRFESDYF